ncbi:hypothetical protein ACFL0L_03725 [Patescibacteria group bacterium]
MSEEPIQPLTNSTEKKSKLGMGTGTTKARIIGGILFGLGIIGLIVAIFYFKIWDSIEGDGGFLEMLFFIPIVAVVPPLLLIGAIMLVHNWKKKKE